MPMDMAVWRAGIRGEIDGVECKLRWRVLILVGLLFVVVAGVAACEDAIVSTDALLKGSVACAGA